MQTAAKVNSEIEQTRLKILIIPCQKEADVILQSRPNGDCDEILVHYEVHYV